MSFPTTPSTPPVPTAVAIRPPGRVRRRAADLSLGVRLSVSGGRSGWLRLAMIAVGIGIGVTMFLVAATIPAIVDARDGRTGARSANAEQTLSGGPDTLLTSMIRSAYRDQEIEGRLLQPEGPRAPLPPGVPHQLAPGDVVLSPALARLIDSEQGAVLRDRWGETVVGTIGPAGLAGPEELTFYLGTDRLTDDFATRIRSFGGDQASAPGLSPVLMLLALVGMVVMLLPVAIFVSTAVRFGSEARDRRLAALRLLGADTATTRRIAAGETLTGAVLGLLVGVVLYLAVGRVAGRLVPAEMSFYPADFRPIPALAALVVVLVPLTAVLVTMSALKRVMIEPLGVTRRAGGHRRRLWWRLALPLVGLVLLSPLATGFDTSLQSQAMVVGGLVFLLVGVALLLPWLVEAAVRRLRGGSVAWELAVRRLQLDSGTAVRAVSGIAVSIAGLIALHGLVTAVDGITTENQRDTETFQARVLDAPGTTSDNDWKRTLAKAPGVQTVETLSTLRTTTTSSDGEVLVKVGGCDVLAQEASFSSCADGDVFVVTPDGTTPPPGTSYVLGNGSTDGANANVTWTLPASAENVDPAKGSVASISAAPTTILLTPAALGDTPLKPTSVTAYAALDPTNPDALDQLRTTAAQADPRAYVAPLEQRGITTTMASIRQALLVGTVALLVIIGASMLVNVVEQLRERRQLLAVLLAVGTQRRTLGGSVFYQIAIPMTLGLVLAVITGTALTIMLQVAIDAPIDFDWLGVGATSAVAAFMVLCTTAVSLPSLWRLTRPSGLHSE